MDGRDVLGLAQTGTGKTAAFVLPILERLIDQPRRSKRLGPRALIVAPTRELAAQIDAEIGVLARFTAITSTTVFGGVKQGSQVRALRAGPDIVVACPGRLLDLHQQGEIYLDQVEVLVLDEADHMFDLGFLPSIKRIVAACPAERQNLLFSATMPREIRGLADRLLRDPHVVELGDSAPAETIAHALYPCDEKRKQALLEQLLRADDFTSAIVFTRTKHRAKRLAQKLDKSGHAAVALQGNMSQPQREKAMNGFRKGTFDVMVATDIAARGIDVAGVSHVINFDVPITPDAYTHRIGRTGRSERTGQAMTFVTSDDYDLVKAIEKRLGALIPRVRLEGFGGERRRGESEPSYSTRSGAGRSNGAGRRGGRGPKLAGGGSKPRQARGRKSAGGGKLAAAGARQERGSQGGRASVTRSAASATAAPARRPAQQGPNFGAGLN